MMSVRTTVYLDEDLLARLRRVVPPRGLNRFVNDALAERVADLERRRIAEDMKVGYLTTREERDELADDWRAVDTEGWPA
jgi:metal-responsive CopG/Arc/MetJ family transcriptional regulator